MILVLAGTHHQPFDRLVRAARQLAELGEDVVVQRGASRVDVPGARVVDVVQPTELAALADAAEVVLCHAGPGCLFHAWERGIWPIVVPREGGRGEHVDDHQVAFAGTLEDRAIVVRDVARIGEALNAARAMLKPPPALDPERTERFAMNLDRLIGSLVAERKARPGLRGRLRNVFLWLGSRRP